MQDTREFTSGSPTTKPKSNGSGVKNIRIQASILDVSVGIEASGVRVHLGIMQDSPGCCVKI